jgi:hypothetical protein
LSLSNTTAKYPQSNGRKIGSCQPPGTVSPEVPTSCGANKPVASASDVRFVSIPSTISALLAAPSSFSRLSSATPSGKATKSIVQLHCFSNAALTLGPVPQSEVKPS